MSSYNRVLNMGRFMRNRISINSECGIGLKQQGSAWWLSCGTPVVCMFFILGFEVCITAVLDNEKCANVQIVVCCGVLMNNM
jgi:hypothetical protein